MDLLAATTQEFFKMLTLRDMNNDGKEFAPVVISCPNPRLRAKLTALLNLMAELSAPEVPIAPEAPSEPASPAA